MRSLRLLLVLVLAAGFGIASASVAQPASAQFGQGGLQANEMTIQAGWVDTTVDDVDASATRGGVRQWDFDLQNFGNSAVAGAQIKVHSNSNGPTLNNHAQFDWSAQLRGPFGAGQQQPVNVPCTEGPSDVTCGPAGAPLAPDGGGLHASSSHPGGPGVPITFSPGFDSARQMGANRVWSVPVTLKDGDRFVGGPGTAIRVNLRGSFRDTGATVNGGGVTVDPCTPSSNAACSTTQFQPGPGGAAACGGSWFFEVHRSALNTKYVFSAQQADCAPSGKPGVEVTADHFAVQPPSSTPADHVTIPDTTLGTAGSATYTVGTPTNFGTAGGHQGRHQSQGAATT